MMSLNEMKYAAFVPGAGEFRLGVRSFSDTRAMIQVPFVAANASLPGEEPFPKSATLADTGGVLVGLVGPAAAAYGVTLTAAADALRDEIPGHAEAAFVIVAYTGPAADVPALAAVVPEAMRAKTTFVVPGDSDGPMALEPALSMPVVTTGMKGRSIGLLRPLSGKPYEAMRLEEDRPGTPEVNMILDSYRTIVHDEGLMKNVGRTPAVAGYVGDKKCAECHQEAYDKLFTTPHQRAIKSLKTTRDEFDPECVRCHVTGWATEGGFVDYETTPAHMNVNCEACHGPGQAHAAKPSEVPTPAGKVDATTCVRCHDPDNSPQFKFEKYWPRIEHR